jgi:hypothetical protein
MLQTEYKYFVFLFSLRRLLVTANVVPSSPILVILMMEELSSFKTSVLIRATQRNIPQDGILHCHRLQKPQILHTIYWLDSVVET